MTGIIKIYWIRLLKGTFFLMLLGCGIVSQAQEQWEKEKEGEIKDVEFEIVKDREIILPRASRNFSKIPPRPYEPIKPTIAYEFKNLKFSSPDYKPVIRPLKLQQEPLAKLNGNYLSLGFGNYASFFGEAAFNTKRDKNNYMGVHLYSRSFGSGPVDDSKSASSSTDLQLFGKTTGSVLTLNGDIDYSNRGTYFYGYSPVTIPESDRDKIRQTYSVFSINAAINNTQKADFNYSLKAGYSSLRDHYLASEGEFSMYFNGEYAVNEKNKLLIYADYFQIARTDSLTSTSRYVMHIRPAYQFMPVEKLRLTAGFNIAFQNDGFGLTQKFYIYPHATARFELGKNASAYGTITGDIDKVDLHSIAAENPWVNGDVGIFNTDRAFEFKAGLNGKAVGKFAYDVGFSFAALKNYYYYLNMHASSNPVPTLELFNRFQIYYDGNTQRVNPYAELTYAQADVVRISIRGDYFSYSTENLQEAFHRPTYKVNFNLHYNLFDKISIDGGIMAQGGMKALDPALTVITLDPAFDLNAKLRYFISKPVSAFLQFNNMLGTQYPLYQGYPVRGFQAMAGVSWSF